MWMRCWIWLRHICLKPLFVTWLVCRKTWFQVQLMEKWSFCLREKWWNFGSNSYQSSFPKPWHSWHRVSKRLGSPGCATVPSPHTTWFLFVKGIPGRLHKECAFPQPLTKVLVTKLMLKERKVRGSFLQHWMVGRGRVRGLELKWKLWILGASIVYQDAWKSTSSHYLCSCDCPWKRWPNDGVKRIEPYWLQNFCI